MKFYDHKKIERKWQKEWEVKKTYKTEQISKKPKHYVLDMFPYPSGEGLHVGHPRGYIGSDVYARMKRMQGYNVLHPMGYDAFGLPAEQYALAHKIHPRKAVEKNVATFEKQLSIIGLSYDWSRKVNTTDPGYYHWTQWIFLQIYNSYYDIEKNKARPISELVKKFEKTDKNWKKLSEIQKQNILMNYRLAYEGYSEVNWCPELGTVLANDEIVDDKDGNPVSERGGFPVEKKSMRQWFMRITAYADRLLSGLDGLDWSEHVKEIQRNWIGKSEGSEIEFKTNIDRTIKIFTTRADTLFGVTYVVLSPEHANIGEFIVQSTNMAEVSKYVREAKERLNKESKLARTTESGVEKTGIELKGIYAINPANGEKVPVWIGDYVLANYGTGAVLAVPAHDSRDKEFAEKYHLPMKQVVEPCFIASIKEGLPFVERNAISAIVKHWSEDKYLGLKWKKADWVTFVTGGVEKGQTPEQAARAEILEETGFLHLKLVQTLPSGHSKFYHIPKGENRFAHFSNFYFELEDGGQKEVNEDEKGRHEVVWLKPEEVEKILTPEGQKYDFKILNGYHQAYTGYGILNNSSEFNNMPSEEAKKEITDKVGGKFVTKYKMRDAIFARQRYWGEPIPLIHKKDGIIEMLPEKKLPLELPNVKSYESIGTGESPLAGVSSWVKAGYETNTMPGWAGSSWYFLRYTDPKNKKEFASQKSLDYWFGKKDGGVDMYIGGAEHATGHLLYYRFWHKFLFDLGCIKTPEPFRALRNQGMIGGADGRKMSKRWGNVINPDDVVKTYGADTLRVYESFMGPFDQSLPWSTESIIGSRRFIEKVWRIGEKVIATQNDKFHDSDLLAFQKILHKTIKKVYQDIENFGFNTAISSMMIVVNEMEKLESISANDFKLFLQILAPFAPHISEELWQVLKEKKSIHLSAWPKYDPKKILDTEIKIIVQINGKVRAELELPVDLPEEKIKEIVFSAEALQKYLEGQTVKRFIYIKNKLVNIVV